MARTPVGETSINDALVITMYSATTLTWAIGDLCDLDVAANFSVKKALNDKRLFGKVVSIQGKNPSTSALSTLLGVRVLGYRRVVKINSDAAVAIGVSAQHNGVANYIETVAGDVAGEPTLRNMVIGSVLQADATYDIYVLA